MAETELLDNWHDEIKGIKKLKDPNRNLSRKQVEIQIHNNDFTPEAGDLSLSRQPLEINNTDNIDANTAKRFRKNEFRVERTLDLHGLTEDRAFESVYKFIINSYNQGLRCVIIITGKGLHASDDEEIFSKRAVLKNKVPQWLNTKDLRPLILSITYPSESLGGSGALYILLKRQR